MKEHLTTFDKHLEKDMGLWELKNVLTLKLKQKHLQ